MKWFILDLDDTLIYTSVVYERARQKFVQILIDEGFLYGKDVILEKLHEVDWELRKTMDVSKNRLVESMFQTYQQLANENGLNMSSPEKARLNFQEIMNEVHNHRYRLVRGAKKLLQFIQMMEVPMILYTRGDEEIQKRKILETGISSYFERIYILNNKTVGGLKSILQEMQINPSECWLIGDEILTDVNHGLTCGLNVIRVWGYHEEEPANLPISNRLINVQYLPHAIPHIENASINKIERMNIS
jgi:putative hydrolase of the HAD superfamily